MEKTAGNIVFSMTIGLLLLLNLNSIDLKAQTLSLPKEWKFKIGDSMAWAAPALDDSNWGNKKAGEIWSVQGMTEVYAWYRVKLVIPSALKSKAEKWKGVRLNLGEIYEVDEAYFNGKLVGHTGSFPPAYKEIKNIDRGYIIPSTDILWDEENTIAVRIFSSDIRESGMHRGPYYIAPVKWQDFISEQKTIVPTGDNGFMTRVNFTSKSNREFNGAVKYWITNTSGKELFSEVKDIHVAPVEGDQQTLEFSDFKTGSDDIVKVFYRITEKDSTEIVQHEQVYLVNKNIDIPLAGEPAPIVANKIPDSFIAANMEDQVLKGYLGKRMLQNLRERLLKIDEAGLIGGYLQRPGSHAWIGEHVGKYLETACNTWKYTHNVQLKKQMDRLMYELIHTQLSDGYLGTYAPGEHWTSWDVWSHKYNLYGLLAYYKTTGYKPALEACKRMGDLLYNTFGYGPGQRDIISSGTHVGMAATSVLDPMLELYKYTGEKKYLSFCYYILKAMEQNNGPKIISSLMSTGKVNKVANAKAYEMISNFVGLIKFYRITGDRQLLQAVLIAWQDIVTNRSYITGTSSSMEHFQEDGVLPAATADRIGEGCVTTTWIQLNQSLLTITGDLKYEEQIERSVYNQLLGAENPGTGCVSYYTSLMDPKPYSCDITCCLSSVPRGIAMIPFFTFGNLKNVPALMLYEPASYKEMIRANDKRDVSLEFSVEGDFPITGDVVITVKSSRPAAFPIALRVPSWCENFTATANHKVYKGVANQFVNIDGTWKTGDKIEVSFTMPFKKVEGGKSYPGQVAFTRGPQVLAFDSAVNNGALAKLKFDPNKKINAGSPLASIVSDQLPAQWIGKQFYSMPILESDGVTKNITLVPFADAGQSGGNIKVWMPLQLQQH